MDQLRAAVTGGTACVECGQWPHPPRLRLTVAKLLAIFPVELGLHAAVLALHPPLLVAVSLLVVTTTALVIWVVEPSTMRLLASWLHAPGRRARARVEQMSALWQLRVTLDDRAGQLERLTHELTRLDANILGLHLHPVEDGVRDELVVSTPEGVGPDDLLAAAAIAGGQNPHVQSTSALALVDGQTKALNLSARVVADPAELPQAVAELLGARVITDQAAITSSRLPNDGTVLKIPSPWSGLFAFTRPGEPFTPAESARAHRLAQLAELARPVTCDSRPQRHG